MSPINKQLDSLSKKINKACLKEYAMFKEDNLDVLYLIIIYRHIGDTERRVYQKQFDHKGDKKRQQQKPAYFKRNNKDEPI